MILSCVKANETDPTRRRVYFYILLADGITPAPDEANGQPQISVNGAAWTDAGIATLTAIGNGSYYADLTQPTVATVGTRIRSRYKSAATAEIPGNDILVVAHDPLDLVSSVWNALTSTMTTVGSVGKKLAGWVLGSDGKAVLSADPHIGATIPTVNVLTGHTPQSGDAYPVAAKLNTMLQGSGPYAFTALALANAPAGGGGGGADPWAVDLVAAAQNGTYTGNQAGNIIAGWVKLYQLCTVSNTDNSATASSFKLSGTGLSSTDGAYIGEFYTFMTGALAGQRRLITSYVGATKQAGFAATGSYPGNPVFSAAPANGDVGIIQ